MNKRAETFVKTHLHCIPFKQTRGLDNASLLLKNCSANNTLFVDIINHIQIKTTIIIMD